MQSTMPKGLPTVDLFDYDDDGRRVLRSDDAARVASGAAIGWFSDDECVTHAWRAGGVFLAESWRYHALHHRRTVTTIEQLADDAAGDFDFA